MCAVNLGLEVLHPPDVHEWTIGIHPLQREIIFRTDTIHRLLVTPAMTPVSTTIQEEDIADEVVVVAGDFLDIPTEPITLATGLAHDQDHAENQDHAHVHVHVLLSVGSDPVRLFDINNLLRERLPSPHVHALPLDPALAPALPLLAKFLRRRKVHVHSTLQLDLVTEDL